MTAYVINAVANLTDVIELEASKQNETVIKFKNKEKKGYYFTAPQITDAYVQSFIAQDKGMNAVKDYIDSLRKGVAKARFDAGKHFSAADCEIDSLLNFAEETSENTRVTKELLTKMFEEEWKNTIAYALVLERDANSAAILLGEDENAKQEFWGGPVGTKFLQIATNYKAFILRGCERKPTFETEDTKQKVLTAISYLDADSIVVQKVKEKLESAPIATVENLAL